MTWLNKAGGCVIETGNGRVFFFDFLRSVGEPSHFKGGRRISWADHLSFLFLSSSTTPWHLFLHFVNGLGQSSPGCQLVSTLQNTDTV